MPLSASSGHKYPGGEALPRQLGGKAPQLAHEHLTTGLIFLQNAAHLHFHAAPCLSPLNKSHILNVARTAITGTRT
jgi:hypothetical protein